MTIPEQYLTSTKNLAAILDAIQNAKAPSQFNSTFVQGLGFKSSSDRLVIGLLKSLGFLSSAGQPTERYYEYLDKSRGKAVLAEALRSAYSDLFELRTDAQNMSVAWLKDKLKTTTKGQYSDAVLSKMASTFKAVAGLADFSVDPLSGMDDDETESDGDKADVGSPPAPRGLPRRQGQFASLVYSIELHLPESRDPAVYDALFRSLKEHLFT